MDLGPNLPVRHIYDAHHVKLAWADEERGVRRVEGLILGGEARDRLSEVPLLEVVQVQARLVKQENRVLVLLRSLREEHHEEGYEPLEALRALIQLDLHAKLVFDHDLEVLTVGLDPQSI